MHAYTGSTYHWQSGAAQHVMDVDYTLYVNYIHIDIDTFTTDTTGRASIVLWCRGMSITSYVESYAYDFV